MNVIIGGYLVALIIPAYFLRLMADAKKLEQRLCSVQAGLVRKKTL
jgi:hypothetical protein